MSWRAKYFTRQEFACPCGSCAPYPEVRTDLVQALDAAREEFDCPVYITSGYRCSTWNKKVGGSPRSPHLNMPAMAADIVVRAIPPITVFDYFDDTFPDSLGLGLYGSHVHVDVRPYPARWDHRLSGHQRTEIDD